jgi:hypothetical protein
MFREAVMEECMIPFPRAGAGEAREVTPSGAGNGVVGSGAGGAPSMREGKNSINVDFQRGKSRALIGAGVICLGLQAVSLPVFWFMSYWMIVDATMRELKYRVPDEVILASHNAAMGVVYTTFMFIFVFSFSLILYGLRCAPAQKDAGTRAVS